MLELKAALSSLSAITNITKGFLALSKDVEVKTKASELLNIIVALQKNLLDMQSEHSKLLESRNEWKKKALEREAWVETREKYKLTDIGGGVLAFSPKESSSVSEPKHYLCTKCFKEAK